MTDFKEMVSEAVREFSKRIEEYAGPEVRQQVIRDGEKLPGILDAAKGALDYKAAIDRLDNLADKPTIEKIMTACGCYCQSVYDQQALAARDKRQQYATEAEFLADFKAFDNGTTLEYKGNQIIQRFAPAKMFPNMPGLRCACMLIGGLPEGVNASPTACECSRGFTVKRWETILGRKVEVEIVSTPIINGTDECVCIIHL